MKFFKQIPVLILSLLTSGTMFAQQSSADCNIAVPACTTPAFQVYGNSGFGLINEIPASGSISNPSVNPAGVNSGCLFAGELNSTWITITAVSTGTLEFSLGDGSSPGCMDWSMWPATSGFANACAGIAGNTLPPVTCNWNGACGGFTGVSSNVPAGASPFDFQPTLNVNAGDQFILMFSNYSGQNITVPINFFGSAQVSCVTPIFICPGESVTLTGQPGGIGYSWSPAAGLSSTNTQVTTATPAVPTAYTCTTTYPGGVTTDTTYDILFNTPPTPNFTITPELCAGDDNATITMNPSGTAPFTYTLNGVPQAGGTYTGMAPGLYMVEVTDGNGCVNDTIVDVDPGPPCCPMILSSTNTQTLCPGSCDGTATVDFLNNANPVTFEWFDAAGNPIGQTTQTAVGLCAGTYEVEVTDPGACTLSETVVVTSAPAVTITSITPTGVSCNGVCDGQIVISSATATQFSIDGGLTFQASNTFAGVCGGNYNIVVENGNGCQATGSTIIAEPTALSSNITGITNVDCNGAFTGALDHSALGGTPPYSYSWNTVPVQTTEDANGIPAGNWCVTVTDNNGCTAQDCENVSQPTPLDIAFLVVNASCFTYCDGNATVIPNGGTAPYSYNWNGIAGTNATSTQANNLCFGTYNLTVTDNNGCTVDTLNFPVGQPGLVQISNVQAANEVCFTSCDGSIQITAPTGFQYSINGGTSFQASNTFNGLCAGVYNIIVEDATGCFNTTTAELIAPNPVEAEFSFGPQPTDIFSTLITFVNQTQYATSFEWTFGDLGTATGAAPQFQFPQSGPGTYEVCLDAYDINGCFDSICHDVVIDDILYYYVPNAFTPDGDGKNDIFIPTLNNVDSESYHFYVYNRWGNVVFETTDLTKGWDGNVRTSQGATNAKSDVYVWKIIGKDATNAKKFELYGHVTLL